MAYQKKFTKPFPGGYRDFPDESTIITASVMDNYDQTLEDFDTEFETVDGKLEKLKGVDNLKSAFKFDESGNPTGVEVTGDVVANGVSLIETKEAASANEANITEINSGLTNVESRVTSVEKKAADNTGEIARVDGRVDELKADLVKLETFDNMNFIICYQLLKASNRINDIFWAIDGTGIHQESHTSLVAYNRIKLEANKNYYINNAYGYFCFVSNLDGRNEQRIDEDSSVTYGTYTLNYDTEKYLYLTFWKSKIDVSFLTNSNILPTSWVEGIYYSKLKQISLPKNEIVVDVNGNGDYTKLKDGIAEAIKTPNTKVYVRKGTYDLINEFGSTYFQNLGNIQNAGIELTNGVHVIFDSNAKVVCNYAGTNENVKRDFSVFNAKNMYREGGEHTGFILENATIECSNIRYAVHDEALGQTTPYKNSYINCYMYKDNTQNDVFGNDALIGGGLGKEGYIEIIGCRFYSADASGINLASYHNCGGSDVKSNIVVKDNYFGGAGTFRLGYLGDSTKITTAIVTNNSFGTEPSVYSETGSTNINMKIISWNNEIRTN